MAKRFTDTDKWKSPYLRGLQGAYKLLWMYILDDCDHAGIWHVDIEVAQIRIGEPIDAASAIGFFKNSIEIIDGGAKWFIPEFIEFQYGVLKEENRAHNSVLKILSRYGLIKNKPLTSPLQGAMDKDKDKDKELDKDKDKDKGVEYLNFPFTSDASKSAWTDYIKHRKQLKIKPYTPIGLERCFKEIETWGESVFIEAVNQSIKNNWQGLFPPKPQINGQTNGTNPTGKRIYGRVEPPPPGTSFGSFKPYEQ